MYCSAHGEFLTNGTVSVTILKISYRPQRQSPLSSKTGTVLGGQSTAGGSRADGVFISFAHRTDTRTHTHQSQLPNRDRGRKPRLGGQPGAAALTQSQEDRSAVQRRANHWLQRAPCSRNTPQASEPPHQEGLGPRHLLLNRASLSLEMCVEKARHLESGRLEFDPGASHCLNCASGSCLLNEEESRTRPTGPRHSPPTFYLALRPASQLTETHVGRKVGFGWLNTVSCSDNEQTSIYWHGGVPDMRHSGEKTHKTAC